MTKLISKLIEQNAHNEERIRELTEHSDERIEKLMKKLSERPKEKEGMSEESIERLISKLTEQPYKEVAATVANDETIKQMLKTQENLMRNQDKLMEKILELSANKFVENTSSRKYSRETN